MNEPKSDNNTLAEIIKIPPLLAEQLPDTMCTGCGSCISSCPVNALELKQDKYGYYRATLNKELCINCGLCVKSCPSLELPDQKNNKEPDCFAFIAKDKELLYNSSSGAVFPLLAREVLKKNGIIVGAAWKDDLTVEHIMAQTEQELEKLKKSKYLQSYLGSIFKSVKKELDTGRFVMFTGCPCQVAGLKKYLGKEYANLISVDLLCGCSPSSMFFKKYLEESFPQGVKNYQFRHKKQGWNADCLTLTLTLTNGTKIERRGGKEDLYQKAYHPHMMSPSHCENCKYQSLPRFGDITIGDFWGYSKRDKSVDTSNGISVVLCNNERGKNFFELISENDIQIKKQAPVSWLGGNGYALSGKHNYAHPNRDKFYKKIINSTFSEAVNYAFTEESKSNFISDQSLNPLQYESTKIHFGFDKSIWEEHFINSRTTLTVKAEKSPTGKFAVLPFSSKLKKGIRYSFDMRFKITSKSTVMNLHVVNMDSPKQNLQIIKSCKNEKGFHNEWVEVHTEFIARSDFNGFGIGALQLSGESAYFMVDYIYIRRYNNG